MADFPTDTGERVAIVVDSCCDVLPSYLQKYPIFVVPMLINYSNGDVFEDRVTITPAEVYERFAEEIPHTSTPTPAAIHAVFQKVADAGYTHVLAFSISSALSSTCAMMGTVAVDYPQLETQVVDTLNIGIGAGCSAMYAAELLEQGLHAADVAEICRAVVPATRIFIVPDSLEYLYKGGRINNAVYQLGTILNLRPIITCDTQGYYAVCAKPRGRKKSIARAVELARKAVLPETKHRIIMAHGNARPELDEMLAAAPENFPDATEIIDGLDLSPALVVHTGPGLLGIVVQNLA